MPMSTTIDANVLLYASNRDDPRHDAAQELIERLAAGPDLLYLFWPVALAYVRIATRRDIFDDPLSLAKACADIAALLERPNVRSPSEGAGFWMRFQAIASDAGARGNLVTDAHIATLMRQYGVSTIWTHDRDFRLFDDITAHDPFGAR
jgi:toxin-antitoxin system PIN domain toxin